MAAQIRQRPLGERGQKGVAVRPCAVAGPAVLWACVDRPVWGMAEQPAHDKSWGVGGSFEGMWPFA